MSKVSFCAVQRKDGSWSVKRSGTTRIFSIHSSRASAWKETKRLARGTRTEALLKGHKGEVRIVVKFKPIENF